MITEIEKKLQKMDKSEIFQICRKMKCPIGTKREMIGALLRPFTKKKYGMSSDEEDIEYIYPSSEEEYSDYELSDSEEEKKPSKPIKKSGLNCSSFPKSGTFLPHESVLAFPPERDPDSPHHDPCSETRLSRPGADCA